MLRIAGILFFVVLFTGANSQPYGNEWIDYGNKYYKIPLKGEGIYRISYQALANGNFQPLNSHHPQNFQLFIRGKEWPIYIYNEGNAMVFDLNDYIEFYAPPTDGWLDSLMFDPVTSMANPFYSLYNDTIYAFLTANFSMNNLRAEYITDVNFSSYSAFLSQWCISRVLWHDPLSYYPGYSDPMFSDGEGWLDTDFQLGGYNTRQLSTPGYTASVYPVSLEYSVVGASNASPMQGINHHLRISVDGQVYSDTTFAGYKTIKKTIPLLHNLSSVTDVKAESVNDFSLTADRMAIGYFLLKYPRNYNFSQIPASPFVVPSAGGSKTLLTFSGLSSSDVVLWDISNGRKILCQANAGNVSALLPDSGQNRSCYIALTSSIKNAVIEGSFQPVDFAATISNSNYYIISHSKLWSWALQYKYYRGNSGYNAALIDIDQLYCQFAYGIYKHPMAIRSFMKYALDEFSVKPEYLFLLGKSIHAGRVSYSECFRKDPINYSRCLIPSWGSPSSDNMLIAGINGNGYQLPLAIGRLAATTANEVQIYLNKVSLNEAQQPAMWMKNILHFSGGQIQSEQLLFASYLLYYENVITDTLFGGQVSTFKKTSSAPVQITLSASIRNLINGGCSMMNFFGHGSSTGFDQNIHDPSYYNNAGKCPLVISNSCLTGDIHLPPEKRLSEKWVLDPNGKGAIAFLASVDLGYADRLHAFTSEFIRQFTYKSYSLPLGKQISITTNKILTDYYYDKDKINTALDFTLHGDPAVVLNSPPQPDLMVDNTSIYFNPTTVTTEQDTFSVNVIVYNQGMAITDTFMVELVRTFPDGHTTQTYYKLLAGCINRDTVTFRIAVDIISGPGPNRFCVRADSEGWIAESNEGNNSVCVDIIVRSGDLIPVHPYEFAIYPSPTVRLKASSAYAFASPQLCVFQIDNDDTFYPVIAESQFTYPGGVAEWQPPFALQDCTVYYWRVSLVPQPGQEYNWKESSFIYIPGKTGWSQAHFYQFKKDGYRFIDYKKLLQKWDFITTPHLLECQTMGISSITDYFDIKYSIDGMLDYSSCGPTNAILIAVIDPETLEPWKSGRETGVYGNINDPKCPSRQREDYYFVYYADSLNLSFLRDFVQNHIPDGHYILVYTFRNGMFRTEWSKVPNLYETFEAQGATHVRALEDDYPYIFFCRKGDIATALEEVGENSSDYLNFSHEIETDADYGYITSTLIGPSAKWSSLHWRYFYDNSDDIATLKVTGISASGNRTEIFPAITKDSLDIYNLEQNIDAAIHPYMEMQLYSKDDSLETPVWMKRWQVTYDGIPETAINPSKGYYPPKDTLEEGETLIFGVATENITEYNMDSLLVRYWLTDRNNNLVPLSTRRLRPHPGSHVLMDSIHINTRGYPGINSIWYEVNTINSSTGYYDQPEQYHFNNYAQKDFYVKSDITNPLLDVTFDGVRILNGDIVSSKPLIVVSLKDENKFMALNDTGVYQVYIKNLQTGNEDRIYFSNQQIMKFIPASLPKNSCKIEYSPSFPEDGKYQLRVQAKDMSENESGDYDYIIQFEVINRSSITNIFNYPNPFSTSTRFVFTLTGSELPEDLRIQIITVTGKVVREINQAELGLIHIGNNVTEYAWDGTDMYGDRLANGVYFYRVIAKLSGSSIEHRETEADKFFNKGFGKMYLIR